MSAPATDDERARFRSPLRMLLEGVEGLALLGLVVLSWPILRPLLLNLGLEEKDRARTWPGDSALGEVTRGHARAAAIEARAADVWPWLLQLGLGKAGFYSYELLERLAGAAVKNVEVLVPAWQCLSIDDSIELLPGQRIWVHQIEEPRRLSFRTWKNEQELSEGQLAERGTWSFYLLAGEGASCRLVVRTAVERLHSRPTWRRLVGRFLEEPLDFVMEQRLLRTLRRLAQP